MKFTKATKLSSKLRLAICGPSGSGKTYTSLSIARNIGKKIAMVDSERGSASKYADIFSFDVLELDGQFHPQIYIDAIKLAENEGYDVIIIDSLSHAWSGQGGALDLVDKATIKTKNSYTAWRDVTPLHNAFIDAMINSKAHIIATMRSKMEYVLEDKDGKKTPRKVGMAPVQREGMEYEFDVVGDMDIENNFIVSKTRCPSLTGGVFKKPDGHLSKILVDWISAGITLEVKKEEPKQINPQPTTTETEQQPKQEKEIDPYHTTIDFSEFRKGTLYSELSREALIFFLHSAITAKRKTNAHREHIKKGIIPEILKQENLTEREKALINQGFEICEKEGENNA